MLAQQEKAAMVHPPGVIALAWYQREDYPRILQIMKDASTMPQTYDRWLEKETARERLAVHSDKTVVKALINPETFPDWCRINGVKADAKGRMRFANWTAAHQVKTV